jgi:hypothetical protein
MRRKRVEQIPLIEPAWVHLDKFTDLAGTGTIRPGTSFKMALAGSIAAVALQNSQRAADGLDSRRSGSNLEPLDDESGWGSHIASADLLQLPVLTIAVTS